MKNILLVFSIFLFSFTFAVDNPVERIGVQGPLVFNDIDFKLAWSDKPSETYYIQEYLPEGERLEAFNQMVTMHLFKTEISLDEAVDQKLKELTARRKTDPICHYQVNQSPDGKEYIVDFLLGEGKNDKMTVVEFNVYRYKRIEIAKGKKAIVVYAYTKRSYGDSITKFLKTLGDDRLVYLNAMIETEIPAVQID